MKFGVLLSPPLKPQMTLKKWIRKLLRNNWWPDPILQCTDKTQGQVSATWEEFIHQPRKKRNWIWVRYSWHHILLFVYKITRALHSPLFAPSLAMPILP